MLLSNNNSFQKDVLDKKGVTVVDFFAAWCGPCKMLSPLLEEMDKENKDKDVSFVKVDVDANQELAASFGIMSIPTVILFKDGRVAAKKIGVQTKEEYLATIGKAKTFDPANIKRDVTIFSTPTCPYCKMAKEYLTQKNIPYKDIDVTRDQNMARQMIMKSGEMGVPQLWINDEVIIGFNKPAIDMALGL